MLRFTRQRRFRHSAIHALNQPHIRRRQIPLSQQNNIARHQLTRGNFPHTALAPHTHHRAGQLLQRRHRFFCAILLNEAQHAEHKNDDQNRQRLRQVAQPKREPRRRAQNQNHRLNKLPQQHFPRRAGNPLLHLIQAILPLTRRHLRRRQTLFRIHAQFTENGRAALCMRSNHDV